MRFGRRFSAIVGGVIRNEGIVRRRRIRLLFGVSGRIASTRRYILLWLLVARCMGYCIHRNSQNILTSSLSIIGAMHTGRYVTACDSQELGKKYFWMTSKGPGFPLPIPALWRGLMARHSVIPSLFSRPAIVVSISIQSLEPKVVGSR